MEGVVAVGSLEEEHNEKQDACGSVNSGGDRKPGQVASAFRALPSVEGTNQVSGSKIQENSHETQHCTGNA
jgi:hypothetical protein